MMNSRNKSIIFLYPTLKVGGAERMLQRLINGLAEDWHCTVAYLEQETKAPLVEFSPQVKLIRLPVRRTRYAHLSVLKLLRAEKPDIVFSSWSRTNLLLLSIQSLLTDKTKVLIREPNLPSFMLSKLSWSFVYELLYKKLYRNAAAIICQSELMKEELAQYYAVPATKLHVLHNMLPVAEIQARAEESELEIKLQSMDIVSCGRLTTQKGYDNLIASFSLIRQRYPAARLIIFGEAYGSDNQRGALENQIAEMGLTGSVFLPGNIANPFKYMHRCAVFVSSSRWEGLPNAVLEAMACGASIVATNCPGATGEIIEHGNNGWLVAPNSISGMSEAVCNVLSGQWRIDSNHVQQCAMKYDTSNCLPKFNELFNLQLVP